MKFDNDVVPICVQRVPIYIGEAVAEPTLNAR